MAEGERRVTRSINYDEIGEAIRKSSKNSAIYIGCDSQQHRKHTIFGLAIIIHIESSKGGKMFVELSKAPRIKNMRQRLMMEVQIAVEASLNLIDDIGDRKFEVHLDVNTDARHQSSVICKEAIGYVSGQGFECKVKPDSFAATHAADHIVRGDYKKRVITKDTELRLN